VDQWHGQPTGDGDGSLDGRASELLAFTAAPLADLILDPGNELSLADDPSMETDAAFMRAFVPVRSYQRLLRGGLDGLVSSIARNPQSLQGRILVRQVAGTGQYVVIDGSRHVAALRLLAETGTANGVGLSSDVTALFHACPVTIVHAETDPAFVLALLADATEADDPWLHGQRDQLLGMLARQSVHHSYPTMALATAGNSQTLRRYHGYRALQQLMQQEQAPPHVAVTLYPLFHAAVGRSVIRTWLDWDDTLCMFLDDGGLDRFYRLLLPTVRPDGTTRPPCLRAVSDVVQLCDVLAEPVARDLLLQGATLQDAVEVINAGAFQQWSAQVGETLETLRWDRRRFGPRT
jgi:hypothetical protein